MKDVINHIFLRNTLLSTSQSFNSTLQRFIRRNQSSSPGGRGGEDGASCRVVCSVCATHSFLLLLHNRSVSVCASAKQYEELGVTEQRRWTNTIQAIWSQHTKGPSCCSLTLLCCSLFVRLCPGCAVAFCVVGCCSLPPSLFPPPYFCMVSNSVF